MAIPHDIPPLHCGQCGYDIRGLPEAVCPECGSDLRKVGSRERNAEVRRRVLDLHAKVKSELFAYQLFTTAFLIPAAAVGLVFWSNFRMSFPTQFALFLSLCAPAGGLSYIVLSRLMRRAWPKQKQIRQLARQYPGAIDTVTRARLREHLGDSLRHLDD